LTNKDAEINRLKQDLATSTHQLTVAQEKLANMERLVEKDKHRSDVLEADLRCQLTEASSANLKSFVSEKKAEGVAEQLRRKLGLLEEANARLEERLDRCEGMN